MKRISILLIVILLSSCQRQESPPGQTLSELDPAPPARGTQVFVASRDLPKGTILTLNTLALKSISNTTSGHFQYTQDSDSESLLGKRTTRNFTKGEPFLAEGVSKE